MELAKKAGWPVEKQDAFLRDRGATSWHNASKETIDEARDMLNQTLSMFQGNSEARSLRLHDPDRTD